MLGRDKKLYISLKPTVDTGMRHLLFDGGRQNCATNDYESTEPSGVIEIEKTRRREYV